MKKLSTILAFLLIASASIAQNVGINTPTPTSSLDINGGQRLRSATTTVSGASVMIASNRAHHVLIGGSVDFTISFVDATLEGQHVIITNSTLYKGFLVPIHIQPGATVELIYSISAWKLIGTNESTNTTAWSRTGNAGTTDGVNNLFGTTDDKPVRFIVGNQPSGKLDNSKGSYFIGRNAGLLATSTDAFNNSGYGLDAMRVHVFGGNNISIGNRSMGSHKSGSGNTVVGAEALTMDTASDGTVAIGRVALFFNQARIGNTAVGTGALTYNCGGFNILATEGLHNTALGYAALKFNVRGSGGVAIGYQAAYSDTAAEGIVAIGRNALYHNSGKGGNVAIGDSALFRNGLGSPGGGTAYSNTAIGFKAMQNNTSGFYNTALGTNTLNKNTSGHHNTAIGSETLSENTTGTFNTAVGERNMLLNTTGERNTTIGNEVMRYNVSGRNNTGLGFLALLLNQTGNGNVGIGDSTLYNNTSGSGNVAIGHYAGSNETTSNNLYIENTAADKNNALIYGDFAADSLLLNAKTINKFSLNVRGSNALEMGYGTAGKQTDAGKISYGGFGDADFLGIVGAGKQINAGTDRVIKLWCEGGLRIRGNALPDANNFYTLGNSTTRWKEVWTNAGAINTSDANLKTNIVTSPYGLDEVMQMHPVQYNWKTNPSEDLQIGFLAQDIQKIIPEAVVVPANGDPLGMKYTELIPVLVKAIQEQQKRIEELEKTIKTLKQ